VNRYDKLAIQVLHKEKFKTSGKNKRSRHEVDIMIEYSDHIDLFNVKNETISLTDDPNYTVLTYVDIMEIVKSKFKKPTSYSILRVGGFSDPVYDEKGIHAHDLRKYLLKLHDDENEVNAIFEKSNVDFVNSCVIENMKEICEKLNDVKTFSFLHEMLSK